VSNFESTGSGTAALLTFAGMKGTPGEQVTHLSEKIMKEETHNESQL